MGLQRLIRENHDSITVLAGKKLYVEQWSGLNT